MLWWWCNREIPSKLPVIQVDFVVENCCASTQKSWNMDARDELFIGNMGGILGMVPLKINPIYTLHSGYLLGISSLKGSLRGGLSSQATISRVPPVVHARPSRKHSSRRFKCWTASDGSSLYWLLLLFSSCFLKSSFRTCVQTILLLLLLLLLLLERVWAVCKAKFKDKSGVHYATWHSGNDRTAALNSLERTCWELTYPVPRHFWTWFSLPKVGYVSFLVGIHIIYLTYGHIRQKKSTVTP